MAANRPKNSSAQDDDVLNSLSTDRRRAFVEHYCQCWNATEAARRAGYSPKTAQEQASRLLSNIIVKEAIAARVAELTMTTDEVLIRLAAHARGSIEDFLSEQDNEFDIETARARGRLGLVRKLKQTTRYTKDGERFVTQEVELYDAQAALVQIGRALGMFVDKIAPTDPTGTKEYAALTDEERTERLAALLERARARRAGPPASDAPAGE